MTASGTQEKIMVDATTGAEMLSISRATFYKWVALGVIPKPIKVGSVSRWPVTALRTLASASHSTTASS
jgi:predicted DNA-binding transcriptional regulator AlpA